MKFCCTQSARSLSTPRSRRCVSTSSMKALASAGLGAAGAPAGFGATAPGAALGPGATPVATATRQARARTIGDERRGTCSVMDTSPEGDDLWLRTAEVIPGRAAPSSRERGRGSGALDDLASDHDVDDTLELRDVLERVALDRDEVGELAGLEGADPIVPAQRLRGDARPGLDRLHRRHAGVDQGGELVRVQLGREAAEVRADADLHAGLDRFSDAALELAAGLAGELDVLLHLRAVRAALFIVFAHVHRRHQVHAALDHQLDRLLVHEGAVLDGAHAGADRHLDPLGGVSVRHDWHAVARGLVDRDLDLLRTEVNVARVVADRHEGAGHQKLDPVAAVLDLPAHRLAHLLDTVDHEPVGDRMLLRGDEIHIAPAAGDRDVVRGAAKTRSREHPLIDRL